MLYERLVNAFVASSIGESNALLGKIESVDGERCRVRLDSGAEATGTAPLLAEPRTAPLAPERGAHRAACTRKERRRRMSTSERRRVAPGRCAQSPARHGIPGFLTTGKGQDRLPSSRAHYLL